VLAGNNQRLSNDNLYAQLKRIVKMAEEGDDGQRVDVAADERIGILTAGNRTLWATAQNEMLLGACNMQRLT
jgi:hypothetical protein